MISAIQKYLQILDCGVVLESLLHGTNITVLSKANVIKLSWEVFIF